MSEEFRPRENDHLVEPIFGALREPAAADGPSPEPRRRRKWFLVLLLLALASLLWAVLL